MASHTVYREVQFAHKNAEVSYIVNDDEESNDALVGKTRAQARADAAGASTGTRKLRAFVAMLRHLFISLFLPVGYPHSVAPEYITFQAWDTIQAMCSYLRGILATRAILEGVGVGNELATPWAATIQWVLRDGASMLGSLVFAWIGGAQFDHNVKSWRLFADVINDVGLTLEMFAPLTGSFFLATACVASVCKALCGVAAGSTRASLTAHFATNDNFGDVAAKEGSQETAVTLLGLIGGMLFAHSVNKSPTAIWTAFVLLTLLHVVANYRAVAALRLRTINRSRLNQLYSGYKKVSTIAPPPVVAKVDPIASPLQWLRRQQLPISVGSPLATVGSTSKLQDLQRLYRRDAYMVFATRARRSFAAPTRMWHIHVVLNQSATSVDELLGYLEALELHEALTASPASTSTSGSGAGGSAMNKPAGSASDGYESDGYDSGAESDGDGYDSDMDGGGSVSHVSARVERLLDERKALLETGVPGARSRAKWRHRVFAFVAALQSYGSHQAANPALQWRVDRVLLGDNGWRFRAEY